MQMKAIEMFLGLCVHFKGTTVEFTDKNKPGYSNGEDNIANI